MDKQIGSGLVIAAPSSGDGKTVITLGLLRAFRNSGFTVNSIKIGPDYIDPAYHSAASGSCCRNLDFWSPLAPSWVQNGAQNHPSSDRKYVPGHASEPVCCQFALRDTPGHRFNRFWMIFGWIFMDFGIIFDRFPIRVLPQELSIAKAA